MVDPERAQGRDFHIGSYEQPAEVHDARKLTASRADLATEKAVSNRGGGGRNDGLAMDSNFYQRDVL